MPRIAYSQRALDDMARLVDFLIEQNRDSALATFEIIEDGVMLLERHPEIGRKLPEADMRELVISRGKTGYVAIYEVIETLDTVLILAIRHQREAGFESL
jgi:plasmid stabilization system protein ParE